MGEVLGGIDMTGKAPRIPVLSVCGDRFDLPRLESEQSWHRSSPDYVVLLSMPRLLKRGQGHPWFSGAHSALPLLTLES